MVVVVNELNIPTVPCYRRLYLFQRFDTESLRYDDTFFAQKYSDSESRDTLLDFPSYSGSFIVPENCLDVLFGFFFIYFISAIYSTINNN